MYFWLILPLSLPVWFVQRRYAWIVGLIAAVSLGLLGSSISDTPCSSGDGCIAYSLIEMVVVWPPVLINIIVGLVRSYLLKSKTGIEVAPTEDFSE